MNPRPAAASYRDISWDARRQLVRGLAAPCALCEIRCGVDRLAGERGRCGLADTTHVYSRMLHFGEEHHLIPSYLVSFSGCSMHCTFCSEDDHLRPPFRAAPSAPQALAEAVARDIQRQRPRAKNINLVGGEPSVSLPFIVDFSAHLAGVWPEHPPLLLNSNAYLTPEALMLCEGMIQGYILDLKFGPGPCGWKVGKVERYFEEVTACLLSAWEFVGRQPEGLVVRHLLMPGHGACCTKPCLQWLEANLAGAILNVMPSFTAFTGTRALKHWAQASEVLAEEQATTLTWLRSCAISRVLWDGLPIPALVRGA